MMTASCLRPLSAAVPALSTLCAALALCAACSGGTGGGDMSMTGVDLTSPGVELKPGLALPQGAAPALTLVTPAQGPTAGGTVLDLTGQNFAPGATVTIAGTAATQVTVVSAT